jgi:hypothetical protein
MRPLTSLEGRVARRYNVERLAKIQTETGALSRYCLITEISDGGVRLNAFGCDVPGEFVLLRSGDGPAKDGRYKVIWRDGNIIGAQLVSDVLEDP